MIKTINCNEFKIMHSLKNIINLNNIKKKKFFFQKNYPFSHIVIDNFFNKKIALTLEKEFPKFSSKNWFIYKNELEIKKALNDWNLFPKTTYKVFNELNSFEFTEFLSKNLFSKEKYLFPDYGLHGGGWHIQKKGGRLNPHLDYSIHPKIGLQRKLNLIVYLNSSWKLKWGGEINLWKNSKKNSPYGEPAKISPFFNRAIIFDTTQQSW